MNLRYLLPIIIFFLSGLEAQASIDPPGKFSFGVLGGTLGYGGEFGYRNSDNSHWQFRLGYTHIGYKKPFNIKINDDTKAHFKPLVRMNLAQLKADYHPSLRSSFRITGGIAYQIKPSYSVLGNSSTGLIIDDINIKPEDLGQVELRLNWWKVTPHLGIGVGRAVPRKRVGGGFELGCYYLGSPKIDFWTDGLLDATTIPDQIPKIEHNMRNYSFLPYLLVSLRVRLGD